MSPPVLQTGAFLPESEPVRIGQADAVAVVDRVVDVESMVAVIELDAVLGIHPVIAACGIADFIGMHLPVIAFRLCRAFQQRRL